MKTTQISTHLYDMVSTSFQEAEKVNRTVSWIGEGGKARSSKGEKVKAEGYEERKIGKRLRILIFMY